MLKKIIKKLTNNLNKTIKVYEEKIIEINVYLIAYV